MNQAQPETAPIQVPTSPDCGWIRLLARAGISFLGASVLYLLSIGPVDRLVASDLLPMDVLYYERPRYTLAEYSPRLDRFLHWYVSTVWGVYEPLLR